MKKLMIVIMVLILSASLPMIAQVAVSTDGSAPDASAMLDVKSTKADLLKKLQECKHSRYPVYDGWRTNIIGFVNIYDCLAEDKDFTNLYGLVSTIHKLDTGTSVLEAINTMQRDNEKIILAMRSSGVKIAKPLGIVTMKDLAEELLGELGEW